MRRDVHVQARSCLTRHILTSAESYVRVHISSVHGVTSRSSGLTPAKAISNMIPHRRFSASIGCAHAKTDEHKCWFTSDTRRWESLHRKVRLVFAAESFWPTSRVLQSDSRTCTLLCVGYPQQSYPQLGSSQQQFVQGCPPQQAYPPQQINPKGPPPPHQHRTCDCCLSWYFPLHGAMQ